MMMVAATHLTDAEIDQFRRRQLPADGLVRFADHLASCADCRERVAAKDDAPASIAALQTGLGIGDDDHLSEEDVQAFAGGGLDEERRAAISAHLAECPACAGETRDLSAFAADFQRSARSRSPWTYGVFAAAAVLVLAVGAGLFLRGRDAPASTVEPTTSLSALAPADAAAVREALASGRLSLPPALGHLRGRASALMGPEANAPAFHLTSPVATVVLETHPTLRWTPLAGSPTYIVTLQDQTTNDIITSPPLRHTEWTPHQALLRGRTYAWQVAASAGGSEAVAPRPPAPPVRFTIADEASAARLTPLPASPLVRGVLYANAGLLDDAEREFGKIDPGTPGADRVNGFLAQLRAVRAPLQR
jgi:hypothetical protein